MKVLIYFGKNELKPVGGPSGYLFNLNKGLKKIDNHEVIFLDRNNNNNTSFLKQSIKKMFSEKAWYRLCLIKYIHGILKSDGNEYGKSFEQFDAVHFHSTADLYKNRELLKNYKGKVILTSHTPEAPYLENKDLMVSSKFPKFLISKISRKFKKIDIYSFTRADNIIFPCKEAMEPYLNTFTYFKNNYESLIKKISYVATGIESKENIRPNAKLLKNDHFKVCYIGRHNSIKGYDLLVKAAKKIEKIDQDIKFVIAGRLGPEYPDKTLKNWEELGWTNDPLSIESACNLFVLPNRETYFDLALIEALSVPSVVLVSDTGGNKYFRKFKTKAINFFQNGDIEDLVKKILLIKNEYDTNKLKTENKKIYSNNFTSKIFAQNYVDVIENILRG